MSDPKTAACPECGRDRGNREPHKPGCSQTTEASLRDRLLAEATELDLLAASKRREAARVRTVAAETEAEADRCEAAAEGLRLRAEGMPYG
jgi:hypothetical protein